MVNMESDVKTGGVDPNELLAQIARSLGKQGIEEVLSTLSTAGRDGAPGIIVGSEAGDKRPYLMSVGTETVDFMYDGLGPFVLPLSKLVELGEIE